MALVASGSGLTAAVVTTPGGKVLYDGGFPQNYTKVITSSPTPPLHTETSTPKPQVRPKASKSIVPSLCSPSQDAHQNTLNVSLLSLSPSGGTESAALAVAARAAGASSSPRLPVPFALYLLTHSLTHSPVPTPQFDAKTVNTPSLPQAYAFTDRPRFTVPEWGPTPIPEGTNVPFSTLVWAVSRAFLSSRCATQHTPCGVHYSVSVVVHGVAHGCRMPIGACNRCYARFTSSGACPPCPHKRLRLYQRCQQ